jgi:hypothetical protein
VAAWRKVHYRTIQRKILTVALLFYVVVTATNERRGALLGHQDSRKDLESGAGRLGYGSRRQCETAGASAGGSKRARLGPSSRSLAR